jgi:hypothetical protein
MDKIECRAVMKFFIIQGLVLNEILSKFKTFVATLVLRFQQLRNGLPSLNVALPAFILSKHI